MTESTALPPQDGGISSVLINLLSDTVERLILAEDFEFISEHQLIKTLQSPPHNLLTSLALKQTHELFQIHFLIFHILYRLKNKWLQTDVGELLISPLKIGLIPVENTYGIESKKDNNLTNIDQLAIYYLDIKHLTETSPYEIDQLILSFWKGFYRPTAHNDALSILCLSAPVTYSDIKKQYKRLASKYHPDKGGTTENIQKINQAMATLSQTYKGK